MPAYFDVCASTYQCLTHVENGDDGGVIPADYSGNVLRLGDLGRDQLKLKEKPEEERKFSRM